MNNLGSFVPANYQEAMDVYPPLWTIYKRPRDYPNSIIVRVWYGEFAGPRIADIDIEETGETAAIWLAQKECQGQGASRCLGRFAEDDEVIVETWI